MIIGTVLNFAMMFFSAWIIWGKGDFPYHYFYLFASAGLIIANTKDFEDVEGDKKYNIKTLPVILGIHNSIRVMIIAMMAITVYVLALYLSDTVMTAFTHLVVILNLLYMIYLVYVDKKQVSILHGAYVTQSSIVNISMLYYLLMIYLFIL
jgi:4-hydroxybenzoate polyprenyltransferase